MRRLFFLLLITPVLFAPGRSAAEEPIAEVPGSLVLVGGGRMPDSVRKRFVELAGGSEARLLVVPTASASDPERSLEPWRAFDMASLKLLHTTDRKVADTEEFVKPLTEATAVWFGGGNQSRITDAYLGTRTEREFHELLKRGGTIGGTSAGTAIASRLMITGGNPRASTGTGFGFLPGFVLDQHFLARDRFNRSLGVLENNPGNVGLGIDESTAVEVRGRRLTVIGESFAVVILAAGNGRPVSVSTLKPGSTADLFQLRRSAIARAAEPFPPEEPLDPVVESGSLVIGGGGGMSADIWKRFIDLAGGPDAPIVVVPTALEDPLPERCVEEQILTRLGARNVRVFHTRDRAKADDPEFVKPLEEARGVWFGGGRQWRFVDAYEGTLAERAFHEVLRRGGVIGGSSAGASIQSEYMPRGHPLGNLEVMAEGYERGFGFLPGVAVDQHFFERGRERDMDRLMGRYPRLLGVGLGEGSAIVVSGSVAEVIGRGRVAVYDRRDGAGEATILSSGERYDLKARSALAE